jgi:DNA-binding MarR family transcriptional regulator
MTAGARTIAMEIAAVVSRIQRRMREVGHIESVTPSMASVLDRLDKDGPASTSDLARADRVRPQSMAATVAALEQGGFIERRRDPGDSRRHLIALTGDTGAQIAVPRRARSDWLATSLDEHFSAAERADIARAVRLLARLAEH